MVIRLPTEWLKVLLHHIKILEDLDFHDIIVSLKASDVNLAVEAYKKAAAAFDYPLAPRHYRVWDIVFRVY